jgi:signal transduction histidine kinase
MGLQYQSLETTSDEPRGSERYGTPSAGRVQAIPLCAFVVAYSLVALAPPSLYAELADVSFEDPSTFAHSVLAVLTGGFDLIAASLLLSTPWESSLRLRAQVGFDYGDYLSFDIPLSSVAGRAIGDGEPRASTDIVGSCEFRDQGLLERSGARSVVAVPLTLTQTVAANAASTLGAPNPIGVMCLYPRDDDDVESVRLHAREFGPFVARLYVAALKQASMVLRRKTVERVAYNEDITSLAQSFLTLVSEEVSVDMAALWVWDPRRDRLYLRDTFPSRQHQSLEETPGLRPNGDSVIAQCFRDRETMMYGPDSSPAQRKLRDAAFDGIPVNWAAIPVKLPAETRIRGNPAPSAGVLELSNHYTNLGGIRHHSQLSWEERFIAEFACELLSVLTYQVLRTQDHESDFERMMHGARTNLQAARSNLQFFERQEVGKRLPANVANLIPNAIDWLEDLEAQINRDDLVSRTALSTEPIPVYGDVLAKLEPMVRRLNTRDPERQLRFTGMEEIAVNYRALPIALANRQALDCVFRNLLDNARKYCKPGDGSMPTVHLRTLTDSDRGTLVLFLSDNGEGIPDHEADLVFEDGFRGELARGLQPQGVGRGLFDCDRLMKQMGGKISLVQLPGNGAMFRIELRVVPRGRQTFR